MPRARTQSKIKNQKSKIACLVPLLLSWFAENARDLPWRRTRDPYAIWVSEIMLQQTQVKTVLPYWERWMQQLPSIESLAEASSEKIHKLWEGLGYYTRVRNMQKAARQIEQAHSSRFPEHFNEVLALPGIGRYTAGAICSIAFNQPKPILDGNVIRVLTRVFGIRENPREKETNAKLWSLAEELVVRATRDTEHGANSRTRTRTKDEEDLRCSNLNQSLMELGALICTPRDAKCVACPISRHCFAYKHKRIGEFPNLGKRPAASARHFAAFVFENRGKFLVRQRPAGVVNAHLWEFPNIELNGAPIKAAAREVLGFAPEDLKPLCTIKHSITRYRITVEAFQIAAPVSDSARRNGAASTRRVGRPALQGQWLPLAELRKLSFPSAYKRILQNLAASMDSPVCPATKEK